MNASLQQIDFNGFDSSWKKMGFEILNWRIAYLRLSNQAVKPGGI